MGQHFSLHCTRCDARYGGCRCFTSQAREVRRQGLCPSCQQAVMTAPFVPPLVPKSPVEAHLGEAAFNLPDAGLLAALGRSERFQRAYVGGTFDVPHRGHLSLLARVRRLARETVLSLNTDEFNLAYKQRRPVMPLADRMAVWGACRLVDRVTVNDGGEDSRPAIERAGADCVIHGSDWAGPSLFRQMGLTEEWLRERGIRLVILPYGEFGGTSALLRAHHAHAAEHA